MDVVMAKLKRNKFEFWIALWWCPRDVLINIALPDTYLIGIGAPIVFEDVDAMRDIGLKLANMKFLLLVSIMRSWVLGVEGSKVQLEKKPTPRPWRKASLPCW